MATDYLVEMKLAPTGTIPTPAEGAAFTERFILPTLEACETLVATGRIVAGGPVLGVMAFSFVARADSAPQLEAWVTSLPLWPRAQTTVTPLGTFQHRAVAVRQRLAVAKAALAKSAGAASGAAPGSLAQKKSA